MVSSLHGSQNLLPVIRPVPMSCVLFVQKQVWQKGFVSVAAAQIWNSLPEASASFYFKMHLKTHFYSPTVFIFI